MQGSRLPLVALALLLVPALSGTAVEPAAGIPLPEHPRPDLERAEWVNLNGDWAFRFDDEGTGERERWFERAPAGFPLTIHVPFSWGAKLSGVGDEADVAWYARTRAGARKLEGPARLPRGRRLGLEDDRLARRGAARRAPGGLHALRAGADEGREAGDRPAAGPPRRRHAAPLQAGGQAGLRQGPGPVADRLPRGAARGLRRLARVPPGPAAEARRAAGAAVRPRRPPAPSSS